MLLFAVLSGAVIGTPLLMALSDWMDARPVRLPLTAAEKVALQEDWGLEPGLAEIWERRPPKGDT